MKKQHTVIPAQDGFFAITVFEKGEPSRDPIIAWGIETFIGKDGEASFYTKPITITNYSFHAIEKPNGKFEVPDLEEFSSIKELYKYLKETKKL